MLQSFELSFGKAIVFYPEASLERSAVALLVRKKQEESLEKYVSDRHYVASLF